MTLEFKDIKVVDGSTVWYTQKAGLFVVYKGQNFVRCYVEESAARDACQKMLKGEYKYA